MSSRRPVRARALGVVVLLVAGVGLTELGPVGAGATSAVATPDAHKVSGDLAAVVDPVIKAPTATGSVATPAAPPVLDLAAPLVDRVRAA